MTANLRPLRLRMAWAWALACVSGALAFALAHHAVRAVPHAEPFGELAYYPSGRWLEPMTLGHAGTAADLAWLRAVQYYGEHRRGDNRFDHLDHVFDILTTLAPDFESAYVFGSFAMAQEGRRYDRAAALMDRGLAANPGSGLLAFEAGFLHFVRPGGRDLPGAAEYFERAARLPGSPASARHFAAYARQNAGDLAVAYALWREVLETSRNRYLQEDARKEMDRIRLALEAGRRELAMQHLTTPVVLLRGAQ